MRTCVCLLDIKFLSLVSCMLACALRYTLCTLVFCVRMCVCVCLRVRVCFVSFALRALLALRTIVSVKLVPHHITSCHVAHTHNFLFRTVTFVFRFLCSPFALGVHFCVHFFCRQVAASSLIFCTFFRVTSINSQVMLVRVAFLVLTS